MIADKIKRYVNRKKIQHYTEKNQHLLCLTPFLTNQYRQIVLNISSQKNIHILHFDESIEQRKVNFVFRHDLDTQKCLNNFHILADIHLELNVPLSVFVRVDDLDYPAKNSFQLLKPYIDTFQVGLHSSCYIYENPLKRLEEEIAVFHEIYQFHPTFLTLHGLGQYKYAERLQLIKDLSDKYERFGFAFTDCIPELRTYNYVIQDCHLDTNGNRYLKKDYITLPPFIKGNCYLLLTHPCYWKK